MNRILEIDESRGVVISEPGVTYGALLAALRPRGLTVGIVPLTGPAGTIGVRPLPESIARARGGAAPSFTRYRG